MHTESHTHAHANMCATIIRLLISPGKQEHKICDKCSSFQENNYEANEEINKYHGCYKEDEFHTKWNEWCIHKRMATYM